MTKHLVREIEKLKKMILALSARVEESLYQAARAVADRDATLAEKVVNGDREIDLAEIEVEEECLKILALHQPVAIDLRFIIAVLKINSDLERIADLAVNIASRAMSISSVRQSLAAASSGAPFDFNRMAEKVKVMVHSSLDALVKMDAELARRVLASDDEIDALHKDVYARLGGLIRKEPELADLYIHYISVSRNLERVADHATNIAEDVIYMIDGEIVRHGVRA